MSYFASYREKIPIKYKCPFCKEEVMTHIEVKASSYEASRRRARETVAWNAMSNKAGITNADPKELLLEMQNTHCPKCKARNPWVLSFLSKIIGIPCMLLDALLFLGFIYITVTKGNPSQNVTFLWIFLVFIIAIDVGIVIWHKSLLAKRRMKCKEFADTIPSDCYPRMLTEQELNSEWKRVQNREKAIGIVVVILFIILLVILYKIVSY